MTGRVPTDDGDDYCFACGHTGTDHGVRGFDCRCPHHAAPGRVPSPLLAGLRAAREVVERQTNLAELVHFERPSDFRKGVLTCLVALDAAIKEAEDA